jgi:hypothetical protein
MTPQEGFDDHVGPLGQLLEDLCPSLALEVQGNVELVAAFAR